MHSLSGFKVTDLIWEWDPWWPFRIQSGLRVSTKGRQVLFEYLFETDARGSHCKYSFKTPEFVGTAKLKKSGYIYIFFFSESFPQLLAKLLLEMMSHPAAWELDVWLQFPTDNCTHCGYCSSKHQGWFGKQDKKETNKKKRINELYFV